jgi:flagellar motor switch protein FliN/FliY
VPENTSINAEQIVTTCRDAAADVAESLSRGLERDIELTVGDVTDIGSGGATEDLAGPGLVLLMQVPDEAAAVVLAESSELLPEWYSTPSESQRSQLQTLAQELATLLLPEQFMAAKFQLCPLSDVGQATSNAVGDEAHGLPLNLTSAGKSGMLHLIWPIVDAEALVSAASSDKPVADDPSGAKSDAISTEDTDPLSAIPVYGRSLLKIKVPVCVTLAQTRQPLGQIVDLTQGSIIQFEKSCDTTLEMEVNNRLIAEGEAVKVGERYGLRITSMILPDERFERVRGRRGA